VQRQLARFGHEADLIPLRQTPELLPHRARVAAALDSSLGRIYLFSVPTTSPELCGWTWIASKPTLEGAVCGPARGQSFYELESGSRLFSGHAGSAVQRVALRIAGSEVDVPLVGRWFLAQLAADPTEFVSYDASGRVVERRPMGLPTRPPNAKQQRGPHRVGPLRTVIQIRSRDQHRPVRLEVARSSGGGTCIAVSSGKDRSAGCGGFGGGKIAVAPMQLGGAPGGIQLLVGPVAPEIRRLDARYEDGRVVRLPLRDGFTLYEVVRADYRKGRRPALLVGRDRFGRVIATRRLPWR
jgi:hypothetical protein